MAALAISRVLYSLALVGRRCFIPNVRSMGTALYLDLVVQTVDAYNEVAAKVLLNTMILPQGNTFSHGSSLRLQLDSLSSAEI